MKNNRNKKKERTVILNKRSVQQVKGKIRFIGVIGAQTKKSDLEIS